MNDSWHSYPKIYNLGHAAISDLLDEDVLVEEKVDGSQFSFGRFGDELRCRSKGQQLIIDAPEKMFSLAVDQVKARFEHLHPGWTYRAEYLQKPKHNALSYDRVPQSNLIIFDINDAEESYLPYDLKKQEAERLGFECVPIVFHGKINSADEIFSYLERISVLGGQKIEGMVIKQYKKFGADKKVLLGKYVSEAFKEVHKNDWKKENPSNTDFISALGQNYRSKARWNKSVQHLKEKGELENSPRDIGKLIKEIPFDIDAECREEIKEKLFIQAWPHIKRIAIAGFPEWYKEQLVEKQFEKPTETKDE